MADKLSNTLSDHIANKAGYFSIANTFGIVAQLYQSEDSYTIPSDGWYAIAYATDNASASVDGITCLAGKTGNRTFIPFKKDTIIRWVSGTVYVLH